MLVIAFLLFGRFSLFYNCYMSNDNFLLEAEIDYTAMLL